MLYAASSIALAALETLVHLPANGLPLNHYLVKVTISDETWDAREILDVSGMGGWDAIPPGKTSIDFGDAWVGEQRSAVLVVPSVVVPEEDNILLNPTHPDMAKVEARTVRKWLYDPRYGRVSSRGK